MDELKEVVDRYKSRTDADFAAHQHRVDANMGAVAKTMARKMEDVEALLRARVEQHERRVETSLQQGTKAMERRMEEHERGVEASLQQRVEQLEAVVRAQAEIIQQLQRFAMPKQSGVSAAEAKAAGLSVSQAKAAGYACAEAKQAGYTCAEAKQAGYSCAEAKQAGFLPFECRAAEYTHEEAKQAGYRYTSDGYNGQYGEERNNWWYPLPGSNPRPPPPSLHTSADSCAPPRGLLRTGEHKPIHATAAHDDGWANEQHESYNRW